MPAFFCGGICASAVGKKQQTTAERVF